MATTYKVVGENPVLGNMPGDTFDAEIDEVQEQRLIDSGALEVSHASKRERDKADKDANPINWPLDKLVKVAEEAGVQLPDGPEGGSGPSKEDVVLSIRNTPTEQAQALAEKLDEKKE